MEYVVKQQIVCNIVVYYGDCSVFYVSDVSFYPRDVMLARVIEIATCPSVCLSVCPSVRHAPVLCQNEES